jgi:putative methionine-R-sulfoxide reductase with GAF domain
MNQQNEKFQRLVEIIFELTKAQDINELLSVLLQGALELVHAKNGTISLLDYRDGKINIAAYHPNYNLTLSYIEWGKGVIGHALKNNKSCIVSDVSSPEWKNIYIQNWKGMKSEIAIPIVLKNIPIRSNAGTNKNG